jgi:hypothetical protein
MSGIGDNGKPCTGYEPRQARYGRGWGGVNGTPKNPGNYSGILECPCNGRYGGDPIFYPTEQTKVLTRSITAIPSGAPCGDGKGFKTAETCYEAIAELGFNATKTTNKTTNNQDFPSGCVFVKNADGTAEALYNTGGTSSGTATSATMQAGSTSAVTNITLGLTTSTSTSAMTRSPKGEFCSKNKVNVMKEFVAKSTSVADETAALVACEAFCSAHSKCNACSVDVTSKVQWAAIPQCGTITKWPGSAIPAGDISQKKETGTATITLVGPADRWFGVGLGAKIMFDQPYTLIVNSTGVSEYKLGTCGTEANHCAGTLLKSSVKIVSTNVVNNIRTVVLTRPMHGLTKDHFTFDLATDTTINYISAIGIAAGAQAFAYHGPNDHDSLTLSFSPPTGPTSVCNLGESGELCWNPKVVNGSGAWGAPTHGNGCGSFTKGCKARQPKMGAGGTPSSGDLLFQHNPTCNSGQYAGGELLFCLAIVYSSAKAFVTLFYCLLLRRSYVLQAQAPDARCRPRSAARAPPLPHEVSSCTSWSASSIRRSSGP